MKLLLNISALIAITTSLSSCAMFINKQVERKCTSTSYVYSDLSNKTTHQYYLPNGKACPAEQDGDL